MENALKVGYILRSLQHGATLPRIRQIEMMVLVESQVSQFLVAAKGNRNEAIFLLAIATGIRQGELLDLKWTDIDWKKGILYVRRQVQRLTGQGYVFDEPKTQAGKRSIKVGQNVLQTLSAHLDRQKLEITTAGKYWQDLCLVFSSTQGTPMDQNHLLKDYYVTLNNTGLPHIHFHDLRHTAASLMINHSITINKVISQDRQVDGFTQVSLSGTGQLIIAQGNTERLPIDAEDNILPFITTQVFGNTLHIDYKNDNFQDNVIPTKPIIYHLAVKTINSIQLSGTGSVDAADLSTDNLSVTSSGAGSVNLRSIVAQTLTFEMSGVGGCDLSGKVTDQTVKISGAGTYHAPDLESENATIVISGAGGATVWAKSSLTVTISGAGSVNYYDNPTIVKTVSGIGSLVSQGNH